MINFSNQNIIDILPNAVSIIGGEKAEKYLYVNKAWEVLTGYSKEDSLLIDPLDLVHSDMKTLVKNRALERFAEGKPENRYDLKLVAKDGRTIWVDFFVSLIDYCGQKAILNVSIDITEKKLYQKKLNESEKRFRKTFHTNSDSININRLSDGVYIDINQGFTSLTGYTREDVINKSSLEINIWNKPEDRDRLVKMLNDKGKAENLEAEFRKKDGTISTGLMSAGVINIDGENHIVSVTRDVTEERRAGLELKKSEIRFRSTLDNMLEGCQIISFDWQYIYVNNSVLKQGHKTKEALLGHTMMEVYPGIEKTDMFKKLSRCMTDRVPVRFNNDFEYPDGSTGYFELNVQPVPEGIFILSIDKTLDRLAEEALRKQNEKMLALTDSNIVGIILANYKGEVLHANDYYLNLLGLSRTDFNRGKVNWRKLTPDEWLPADENALKQLKKTGRCEPYEKEYFRSDGVRVPVLLTDTVVSESENMIAAFVLDMSKQKESEKRFRTVFEQTAVGVISASVTGRILEANEKICQILGYKIDELKTLTIFDITHPDDVYLDKAYIDKVVDGDIDSYEIEKRFIHKNGHPVYVRIFSNIVRNNDGSAKYTVAVISDISQKLENEKKRRNLENQLIQAQKMEAVGSLAGGVAHDFNNMLTVIKGYCGIILDSKVPDNIKIPIEQIKLAGEKAAGLTSQLLAFSRKQIIKPVILDLNKVIKEQMKMLGRLLGEDIEISIILDSKPVKIKADQGQIDQIIMNIAINARDAMPLGGKLTVETCINEFDDDYLKTHNDIINGRFAMLAITDTGTGMNEATRLRIFEPFFTTKDRGSGTGLGLATVFGIVKQNKGFIYVYSEEKQGTTFKIYLPLIEKDDTEIHETYKDIRKTKGAETILLVEDDNDVRIVTENTLNKYGFNVISAANGEKGLKVFMDNQEKIDLLLTDVIMPVMSGRELANKLKIEKNDLKVVFFSGYTDNSIVHHGVLEKDVEFIQKPYSSRELVLKIREVLDK